MIVWEQGHKLQFPGHLRSLQPQAAANGGVVQGIRTVLVPQADNYAGI